MIRSLSAKVTRELSGARLDLAAVTLFSELSRKKIKSIIDAGGAYVGKKRILFAKHCVQEGDTIELFWEVEVSRAGEGQTDKFARGALSTRLTSNSVLFENEDFLVVNKPAGVASQATLTSDKETILRELQKLDPRFAAQKLELVHRLDKDTSGVFLVAKKTAWRNFMETAFRERRVTKKYVALCFGVPEEERGSLRFPIAKDVSRPNAYYPVMNGRVRAEAKEAETDFVVVETFKKSDVSRIECFPKTGRTHQLRVHLMALGCPILGDKTYAVGVLGHALGQLAIRQMLHAESISFKGPDRKVYTFDAPLPQDFADCLETIRKKG